MLVFLGDERGDYAFIVDIIRSYWLGPWETKELGWGPNSKFRTYSFPLVFRMIMQLLREESGDESVLDFWTHPIHYCNNTYEELEWPSEMY